MEKLHCDILRDLRNKIIDDLDVYNGIICPLISEYVLHPKDIERIKSGETKKRRAQILLDVLPSCGPHAFNTFHEALKHHYDWLSEEIEKILSLRKMEVTQIERSASPGSPNLPPQPSMNIKREAKMEQLKEALKRIEPGGYLALHGMKGFGKSCLTANTLKDTSLVKNLFTNQVYWIKFGYERSIDDEILIQLNFLYHQVKNTDTLSMNIHTEPLKEQLVHSLKSHFGKVNNRNALLILDDVWNKKIIDAFDFHCKTLVITTDSDFLDGKQREIIEMKDGFTEAESLGLFAKVLKIDIEQLPPEAKKIHEECNGMPILIAMFAAHFEEFRHDMQLNEQRWKYYLNSLRTKDPTNRVIEQFLSKQRVIFDMCIDRLKPEAKRKYEALAIFSEDVNIMPETLAILWGGERFAVEEQMIELCHKSLAAKHWNADLKSYVYGVHDLLLCHLRRRLGAEKLRDLHKSFVEKYRRYCDGNFSKLPNDNYSYSYIGHHLEQAELHNEFPKLYLDFDFIREKINHTGLSDLLIDLKKYRTLIIKDDETRMKLSDLEIFLENRAGVIAEHRRRKCLDLVQIGMNCTTKKYVYEKARRLADLDLKKLFVAHDGPTFTLSPADEIPTEAKAAYFTDDPDKILIGNYSGQVILWDCKTRARSLFYSHGENNPVQKIIVSNSANFFITLCGHGEVHHFALREDEHDRNVHSPREKQYFWTSLFGDKVTKVQGKFFIDAEIITDMALSQKDGRADRIGVCTDRGTIRVWEIDGKIIFSQKTEGESFLRIAFTREGSMLHLMDKNGSLKFYVEKTDGATTTYSYVSTYNPKLQHQRIIFFQALPQNERSLIIVTELTAVHVKWEEICNRTYPNSVGQVHSFMKRKSAEVAEIAESPDTRFTSAALTYDGNYLITADSKGSINVWKFVGGFQPIATYSGHVTSLDTYWHGEDFHLICGCGKNVIYRWELALEELPKSVRKPLFDAVMKPWGEENIVAKEVHTTIAREIHTSVNAVAIHVYRGDTLIGKTEPVEGSITRLSLNSSGDKILYATDKWLIMLFDATTNVSITILKLSAAPSIVTFVTVGGSTSVVCGENDSLKVWFGKIQALVQDTGMVTSIYTIYNEYVLTVARNGSVKIWRVHDTNWTLTNALRACNDNDNICHSSLNSKENLIGLLNSNGEMIIYEILENEKTVPTSLQVIEYVRFSFKQKLTCCEFSKDDNYLAIGLENGDISIFDITGRFEVNRLELHCNEVRELHWAPNNFGGPILLSVNCDELAWWNVGLLLVDEAKGNRPSRMGLSRSTSSLGFNARSGPRLAVSQSMDAQMSKRIVNELEEIKLGRTNGEVERKESAERNGEENGHSKTPESYFKDKIAKNSNRKALLSIVPLPPSCNSKVCVSDDFSKFLSVDIHGIVSNFKFYNYNA